MRQTLRYYVSSNASTQITINNLLNACGLLATSATTGQSPWSVVRVKKVLIWPGALSSGKPFCYLAWSNDGQANVCEDTHEGSIPDGVTQTAGHCYIPPRGSLVSFWQNGNLTSGLFQIECSVGSIVDVVCESRFSNLFAPPSAATIAGATTGLFYWPGLNTTVTPVYQTLGRPTL
jgi:hypothetical protein